MQAIELLSAFGIHLTANIQLAALDSFTRLCHRQNWKPLHIVLDRGATTSQPMATIRGAGSEPDAISLMKRSAETFTGAGFTLARTKIEFDITGPLIPDVLPVDAFKQGRYFEHHLKLRLQLGDPSSRLVALALAHGAHWSRNALKQFADGHEHRFLTLRHLHETKRESLSKCEALMAALSFNGFKIVKRESEYCAFDSKCDLDAGWFAREGSSHV